MPRERLYIRDVFLYADRRDPSKVVSVRIYEPGDRREGFSYAVPPVPGDALVFVDLPARGRPGHWRCWPKAVFLAKYRPVEYLGGAGKNDDPTVPLKE